MLLCIYQVILFYFNTCKLNKIDIQMYILILKCICIFYRPIALSISCIQYETILYLYSFSGVSLSSIFTVILLPVFHINFHISFVSPFGPAALCPCSFAMHILNCYCLYVCSYYQYFRSCFS